MIPAWVAVAAVFAAAGAVWWCRERRAAAKRSGRCPRGAGRGWLPARRPATWAWRRFKAVAQPGHAWPTRVRNGLSWEEWAMRGQVRMPLRHPESMTAELDSADESWPADLDEQMEAW
jgi:hypothetical protein